MAKRIMFLRSAPYDEDPKGYNIQGLGLGKAFVRLGYDYDFVNDKSKNQKTTIFYEKDGHVARLIEYPRIRFIRWGINRQIVSKKYLQKYDYIISREYYQIMTYWASKNTRNLYMYSGPYYNMFMFPFVSPIYDALFTKKMDKNINFKFVKSELAKEFMERKGYTNVINVGVGLDVDRFEKVDIQPETQKIVDFMKENKCILYIGALSDRKNYPFLLKVYEEVLRREPDVKLVLIGKSKTSAFSKMMGKKDESYAKKVNSHIPQNVLNGIYHVSRVENPQLKFVYPLAQAFLLPSKLEIFGMVLLEAMYFGAPIVSSKNGGSVTLMCDGLAGQIVENFDEVKWADAVCKYLNDPDYSRKVSEYSKELIRKEYTWDAIAVKMLTYIEPEKWQE